jgi:hypothetical protein
MTNMNHHDQHERNEQLPFLVRLNGREIYRGVATQNVSALYDEVTAGELAPDRGHSDEEILRTIDRYVAADDLSPSIVGSCLVLWARAMGREDFARILRDRRCAYVEITGTLDVVAVTFGCITKEGQPTMWPEKPEATFFCSMGGRA